MKTTKYSEENIFFEFARYGVKNKYHTLPSKEKLDITNVRDKLYVLPYNSTGSHWMLILIGNTHRKTKGGMKNIYDLLFVNSAIPTRKQNGITTMLHGGPRDNFVSNKWFVMKELKIAAFDFKTVTCK